MDDIEQICDRLIMIDMGRIIYDGTLKEFKETFSEELMLTVEFADESPKEFDQKLKVIKNEGPKYSLLFNKNYMGVGEAVSLIIRQYNIIDIRIHELDVEEIVRDMYSRREYIT